MSKVKFELKARSKRSSSKKNKIKKRDYTILGRYLNISKEKVVTLSFEDIEVLIGEVLPDSAYFHRAWWGNNNKGHSQAGAWLDVGWRIQSVDLGNKVIFIKTTDKNILKHKYKQPIRRMLKSKDINKNYVETSNKGDLMKKDPRVIALLEFREKVSAHELVPVLEKEATILIKEDPFAFLFAGVLDRGTKAEIIWTIPYYIKKQNGVFNPRFFAGASLLDLDTIFHQLPRKPRYINDAPRTVKELSQLVMEEYGGQAQKIWENKDSRTVKATLEGIYGVGPGIASMIVLLLERWYGVYFNDIDHRNMDVKPDVHIIRVFNRLGFITEYKPDAALRIARELNPEYPGALDTPAWKIGRTWCTAFAPDCDQCPMNKVCPKIIV